MRWSEKPVYICCGATDMRKQINGLMTLVQENFSLDPFSEALFVFCNIKRNRLKILEWDGDGFWLYFKRLERGRFRWPTKEDTATMVLDVKELSYLWRKSSMEKRFSSGKSRNDYFAVRATPIRQTASPIRTIASLPVELCLRANLSYL
jgi:transposase